MQGLIIRLAFCHDEIRFTHKAPRFCRQAFQDGRVERRAISRHAADRSEADLLRVCHRRVISLGRPAHEHGHGQRRIHAQHLFDQELVEKDLPAVICEIDHLFRALDGSAQMRVCLRIRDRRIRFVKKCKEHGVLNGLQGRIVDIVSGHGVPDSA